jgi:MFS family permease
MSSFSQLLARRRDASSSLVLLIVSAGFSLATLDLFIVNVALPKIAHDFGSAGLGDLSWVLNAYAIVFAALLVLFGRLADRFPREYGFLLGVAVFTVASALCATANSTLVLVIFRIVQAAGAALMTPTSLSMVLATSSGKKRDNNVRAWTAISGLMAALGPVVGGLLVAISWRWVFLVNIPFGLAVLVFGWMRLPHVRGERIPYPNALGAALVTAGVALLTLGLVKGDDWGWGSTQTIGVLVGSATRYSTVTCSGGAHSRARRWSQPSTRSPLAGSCSRSCCGIRTSGTGRHCTPGSQSRPARFWSYLPRCCSPNA